MKILEFLSLTHKRFMAKSPVYFKVITTLMVICTLLTGLPELLAYLGVELPDPVQAIASKTIAIAAFVAALIAKLTVEKPEELTKAK